LAVLDDKKDIVRQTLEETNPQGSQEPVGLNHDLVYGESSYLPIVIFPGLRSALFVCALVVAEADLAVLILLCLEAKENPPKAGL
jgi:hypothetical protein